MRERCVPWHKGATRLRGRLGCLIQSGSECSNDRLDLAHMPSRGEGRTFEPRGPGPPAGRGRGHGSGASSASPTAPTAPPSLPLNSPKNQKIFQWLEKQAEFSNDWKNFSPVFQRLEKIFAGGKREDFQPQRTQKGREEGREGCGRDANIENHENRFADMERREGCGWDAGARAARSRGGGKQGKHCGFSIISRAFGRLGTGQCLAPPCAYSTPVEKKRWGVQ